MVSVKFAPLLALLAVAVTGTSAAPQVHAGVHRTLRQQGTVNLIVTLKEGTENTLNNIKEAEFATRGQRIASLVESLEQHAATTQAELTKLISQEASSAQPLFSKTQSYWISNQVYVKDATFEFVEKLAALDSIYDIREEQILPVPTIEIAAANTSAISPLANEWGVTKIQAPTVWASGNTGTGVVVGSIDTGVLYTHTALKANYRSTYGWYDPGALKTAPYDDQGHGTHTMGTIAGSGGIGVAPGATWITCRACTTDGCSESDLLACAQFMTCPTTPTGASKDCTKAPDLVSNSWGGGQGDTFYQAAVNAWVAAGIVPVFANGNAGPACKTANSPGDYKNVIAVGSTTSTDALSSFSSKGPSVGGLVKPEVSAPGSSVRSAWYTSTTAYNTISGTSMATPHVSGVIALLLSAKPSLTVAQITAAIKKGVDTTTLAASGYTCGSTSDSVYPNNQYGYGRINAVKTIAASV